MEIGAKRLRSVRVGSEVCIAPGRARSINEVVKQKTRSVASVGPGALPKPCKVAVMFATVFLLGHTREARRSEPLKETFLRGSPWSLLLLRLLLGFCCRLGILLLVNPGMRSVGNFSQNQQVIASKTVRTSPLIVIFVDAAECRVVANTTCCIVFPDCGFYLPQPDLMNRFVIWHVVLVLLFVSPFNPCLTVLIRLAH
jgi:hypothetical protein